MATELSTFLGVLLPSLKLYCDIHTAIHIPNNPFFMSALSTLDRHFVRERIVSGEVTTTEQLTNIFTKVLGQRQLQYLASWACLISMLQLQGQN